MSNIWEIFFKFVAFSKYLHFTNLIWRFSVFLVENVELLQKKSEEITLNQTSNLKLMISKINEFSSNFNHQRYTAPPGRSWISGLWFLSFFWSSKQYHRIYRSSCWLVDTSRTARQMAWIVWFWIKTGVWMNEKPAESFLCVPMFSVHCPGGVYIIFEF